jgi:hypothetical protein
MQVHCRSAESLPQGRMLWIAHASSHNSAPLGRLDVYRTPPGGEGPCFVHIQEAFAFAAFPVRC